MKQKEKKFQTKEDIDRLTLFRDLFIQCNRNEKCVVISNKKFKDAFGNYSKVLKIFYKRGILVFKSEKELKEEDFKHPLYEL